MIVSCSRKVHIYAHTRAAFGQVSLCTGNWHSGSTRVAGRGEKDRDQVTRERSRVLVIRGTPLPCNGACYDFGYRLQVPSRQTHQGASFPMFDAIDTLPSPSSTSRLHLI